MHRFAVFFLAITVTSSLLGCATQAPQPSPEPQVDKRTMQEIAEELKSYLSADLKEVIREEVIPEIQGLSVSHSKGEGKQHAAKTAAFEKTVIGRIEWVTFSDPTMRIRARIDTGAQTCSMHAENIQEKVIDGEKYVQFETHDYRDKKHVFIKKVVDRSNVRSSTGETTRRYVVRMTLTLGNQEHEVNVNLNDRSTLRYNFLVGRNLMMGNYIVDVSQSRLLGREKK